MSEATVLTNLQERSVAAQESVLDAMKAIAEQAAFDRLKAKDAEARMEQYRAEEGRKQDEARAAYEKRMARSLELNEESNALLRRIAEALESAIFPAPRPPRES
ncbi:MAG TPA: hypothetical protein VGI97_00735 [Gemmatimonadaceae bacterium]